MNDKVKLPDKKCRQCYVSIGYIQTRKSTTHFSYFYFFIPKH